MRLGKTTFLARQTKRAAEKYGEGGVLVASLTKAAAQEVGGRDTGIHARMVSTLHSHAFRALDYPDLAETRQGVNAWNDWVASRDPRMKLSDKYSIDPENAPAEGPVQATDGERMLEEVAMNRAMLLPVEGWRVAAQHFYSEWCEFKREAGMLDFTDLIDYAFESCPQPPGEPDVMMLDEAQDMSRIEMRLARSWGSTCEQFVVVGDPYQNLYEWRGSEPEAFYGAEAASERVLSQSYRVPAAVHRYAVQWAMPLVPDGHTFPEYHARREDPKDLESPTVEGEIHRAGLRWRNPDEVIKAIYADLEAERTVMILASCGFMLDPLCAALRQAGLPFHNPYRIPHGGWNPMRSANRLTAFLRPDPGVWGDEARIWTWDDLRLWTEVMQARGILTHGSKAKIAGWCKNLKGMDFDALDLATVAPLFEDEAFDRAFDLDVDWWKDNLLGSKERSMAYPVNVLKKHGKAALRDEPKVILGTIHSVKGGEADSVYVFPDLSRQAYWNGWQVREEEQAQVRRQFYVAFTRARYKLTLCEQSGHEYVNFPHPEAP